MWFDAFGFEGRLQVTRCGMVRSVDRVVDNYPRGKRLIKGRLLKCSVDKSGYKRVDLRVKSKLGTSSGKSVLLHRIVASTFIPGFGDDLVVNHIDGNKLNNNVSNLEWCTKEYNHKHAWKSGFCDSQKKPVIAFECGGFGVWLPSMHYARWASASLIHAVIHGRQKTHRGMKWDYCPIPENSEYAKLTEQQNK